MKKFFRNIITKPIRAIVNSCKKVINKISCEASALHVRSKSALCGCAGEGYVDTAVKIIISVVVGSIILASLYALFDTVVMPRLETEIQGMFNYSA